LHLNRAAAERNLLARQVVLAVGGQQLPRWRPVRGRDVFGRWLAVQLQRSRIGFVEITFRVISAQHVLEFASRAGENFWHWLPFRKARVVDRDRHERYSLQ